MDSDKSVVLDLDHIVRSDGRIYRVVGNLHDPDRFLGYNVYSPALDGDRIYGHQRYKKNYFDDNNLPADVLDTYELVPVSDIVEHHDPIHAATTCRATFRNTIWDDLYGELARVFGETAVGIFGSSMFGLHLTPDGCIRKDVDFVVQGAGNIDVLRRELPAIRDKLGFTPVTAERQLQQYARYRKLFQNSNNSIRSIIARRWTGLQLSEHIVTTIRFRDPRVSMPVELVTTGTSNCMDIEVSGRVTGADDSNLFPRKFHVVNDSGAVDVYTFWWKFSTPVRDGDFVTLCGSLITINNHAVVRLTSFRRHWLRIEN